MAEWLAVGQEMVIVVNDTQAIRVTTNAEEITRQNGTPISPLATPAAGLESAPGAGDGRDARPEDETQNTWEQFWSWLWGN
jgi:hypothetical protein